MTSPDLADELARWLEELGLVEHLAAAGLPTFERADGVVRWLDPGTGAALDARQLSDLDRLLHHEGAEPRHAVPVALVQLAHQARLRESLLTSGWLDYAAYADRRGLTLEAARFAVHREGNDHRLLVVPVDTAVAVPTFQLDDAHGPRRELAPVLSPLLAAGMDPWRVWAWLTQPAALVGGLVPERAVRDPDEVASVRYAARRLAERS